MRKHAGVATGTAIAVVGLLLAIASLAGFSVGLPAVQPATALGASWFMIAVVMIFGGTFAALAARGLELDSEERAPVPAAVARVVNPVTPVVRPVVHLRPVVQLDAVRAARR